MANIPDTDRNVFAELNKTTLDNFTDGEQEQIRSIAGQLRTILDAAKKRGGGFQSPGFGQGFQPSN